MCSLTLLFPASAEGAGRVGVDMLLVDAAPLVERVVDEGWEEEAADADASCSASLFIWCWAVMRNACIVGAVVSRGTSPMGGKVDGRSLYGFGMLAS